MWAPSGGNARRLAPHRRHPSLAKTHDGCAKSWPKASGPISSRTMCGWPHVPAIIFFRRGLASIQLSSRMTEVLTVWNVRGIVAAFISQVQYRQRFYRPTSTASYFVSETVKRVFASSTAPHAVSNDDSTLFFQPMAVSAANIRRAHRHQDPPRAPTSNNLARRGVLASGRGPPAWQPGAETNYDCFNSAGFGRGSQRLARLSRHAPRGA